MLNSMMARLVFEIEQKNWLNLRLQCEAGQVQVMSIRKHKGKKNLHGNQRPPEAPRGHEDSANGCPDGRTRGWTNGCIVDGYSISFFTPSEEKQPCIIMPGDIRSDTVHLSFIFVCLVSSLHALSHLCVEQWCCTFLGTRTPVFVWSFGSADSALQLSTTVARWSQRKHWDATVTEYCSVSLCTVIQIVMICKHCL